MRAGSVRVRGAMMNVDPVGKVPSELIVAPWSKYMMYLVCLVPTALLVWASINQALMSGTSSDRLLAIVGICPAVYFAWLFRRIYMLFSINVGSEGIAQSFLFREGKFMIRVSVTWDQIQKVSFSHLSFHFMTDNGLTLELNIGMFDNDVAKTVRVLRQLLPSRLLAQLT
jgi:hypothetical protein